MPEKYTIHTYKFHVAPNGVIDGDTLSGTLRTRTWYGRACDAPERIRLAWIDCPELHSHNDRPPDPYAIDAKALTQRYCEHPKGRWIKVQIAKTPQGQFVRESHAKWPNPRLLANVLIRRWWGWSSLNLLLLRKGLAQPFEQPDWISPRTRRAITHISARAQQAHRGIYQGRTSWWRWGWLFIGAILFFGGILAF